MCQRTISAASLTFGSFGGVENSLEISPRIPAPFLVDTFYKNHERTTTVSELHVI